jgi:thymidylate synthase
MRIDTLYMSLLMDVISHGRPKSDRTGTGTTSLFGLQLRYNMADGFPLLTTKKLHVKSIIHELLWFLKGDTNVQYLRDHGVTIWDEWADERGELGPVYGKQWVNWPLYQYNDQYGSYYQRGHVNQIEHVLDRLVAAPDSRRLVVSAWNVPDLDRMALVPCHYSFQLYSEELMDNSGNPYRRLSLLWNQRSVDIFLGRPFNIASYGFLLHMFAQQAGMVVGDLIGSFGDVHLYDNHRQYAQEQLTRNEHLHPPPHLELEKAPSIFEYKYEHFNLNYDAHPNWKGVPIAV